MSIDTKYWVALAATLVTGAGIVQLYGQVFNGIENPSRLVVFAFIVCVLLFMASATSYYYLRAARKNPKRYGDLSILTNIPSNQPQNREEVDKK